MVVSVIPATVTDEERRTMLLGSIVPRPIAWTSTVSSSGVRNFAPFNFFTVVSNTPPMLSLTLECKQDGSEKDTLVNIKETGEFVVNVVSAPLIREMVLTSHGHHRDVDEFAVAKVTPVPSQTVSAPRVAEAPISMECKLVRITRPGSDSVVIGRVERFHFDESVIDTELHISPSVLCPVGRLGRTFSAIRSTSDICA
ncbi:flavin reductase family protein [Streptomyces sp. SL13]|uniref:Flavin reductase family protein n=1 Tax=Streptantibioticus silvisoli TaxID=2705255 RepID=A0AA90HA08_9ACTN|nr:flavin reductase family protein [Streptantibioticus silvisoli]MDI5973975.1 flavin reductase family protein [Streptantibioticus silvisoli]